MATTPNPRIEPEMAEILSRHHIDPFTVIHADVEHKTNRMWRTPGGWPAGGTYEAAEPKNPSDTMVASRVTTTIDVEILGQHPEGRLLPVHDEQTRSWVTIVETGAWQPEKN